MNQTNAIRGGLYGLLVGDAVGVPYEFKAPANIPEKDLIDIIPPVGYKRSHSGVPIGSWSDDGSQALCLLASLLEHQSVNMNDLMEKFANWYQYGYMAINGKTYDCGIQTANAIGKYLSGVPAEQSAKNDERSNGNGALMRTLPLVLWHQGTDDELIDNAFKQSHVTHAHIRSKLCCALYCLWARYILQGGNIQESYQRAVDFLYQKYQHNIIELTELNEDIQPFNFENVSGSGYVVDCLKTAYIALQEPTFKDVIQKSIQFGYDTDTTACVAGGIAGLYYGFDQIPQHWIEHLLGKDIVEELLSPLLT